MQETMPGPMEYGFICCMIVPMVVIGALITVIPFWKICSKAGFPGALSLLMLVPVANLVLPFYIAFADWPALRQARAGQPPMGPGPMMGPGFVR